ncbi:MAG: electron transport complex subunit RsxA [Candidatus Bipolaricaulota bacterium]|nr:electron transport complex subunit RsxA [Candidatus Bipolaricaulota bacterium]
MELFFIFVAIVLTQNFVLHYFLGICPFLGVSDEMEAAFGMGIATTFVMTLTAIITWNINTFILEGFGVQFLEYVSFILVIASLVQLVEMFLKKYVPELYKTLGIYLPLITTNCAVMGLALFMVLRDYNFVQSAIFGFGAGVGFTLALIIMAGIRSELMEEAIPEPFRGTGITLLTAGLLALAFMGFSGLVPV